mmetsp:Transcript_102159/g.218748  ORF Transcript_102159/g.218748 Transcript_102159/m.218748 type:complete len:504 (-) Transcript_102159:25-1536(-)
MASPALPELPPLAALPRGLCRPGASDAAEPPGALPRHVAPPSQSSVARGVDFASGSAVLVQVPHRNELPPLQAASLLASSRVSMSRRGSDLDISYDTLSPESKVMEPHAHALTRSSASRLALVQLDAVRRGDSSDDSHLTALNEIESLKRQVSRLTQQRRDRESYIQDLLAEAETTQRRHESEMSRRIARCEREASERLAAQLREHNLLLQERDQQHAAVMAQQERKHGQELLDLRKAFVNSEQHEGQQHRSANFSLHLCKWSAKLSSSLSRVDLSKALLAWRCEVRAARALAAERSQALEDLGRQVVRARLHRDLRGILFAWAVALRDARSEAKHRHQLLAAAAEASAELYRIRADSKRAAVELRKQRRAHGIAAIHGSLDRCLQAALQAWSVVAKEQQRESVFQRLLDIAAAESNAAQAVLRMEGRRKTRDLRYHLRAQALKVIAAVARHWKHATFQAWAQSHREALVLKKVNHALSKVMTRSSEGSPGLEIEAHNLAEAV